MTKTLRMLIGTMILAAAVAATAISQNQPVSSGGDPVPACPPGGCLVN